MSAVTPPRFLGLGVSRDRFDPATRRREPVPAHAELNIIIGKSGAVRSIPLTYTELLNLAAKATAAAAQIHKETSP